jgi:GTP cyclohydrolase I
MKNGNRMSEATISVPTLADPERIRDIAAHFRGVIQLLGLDTGDPNLVETPERMARMYLELFQGLSGDAEPKVTFFPNDERYTAMVMEKDIPFYSLCSHHFVPFYGHAHVAYIPNESIVGLSKMARIVEFYARRPQLQERLTEQIAGFMAQKLDPQGVMVVIEARHLCVEMRGVRKPGALTVTSAIRGIFNTQSVREEFLDLLNRRGF